MTRNTRNTPLPPPSPPARNTPIFRSPPNDRNARLPKSSAATPVKGTGFVVNDVSFSYGQKPLFEGLSVTIGCREFCSVVGPNGAGKSTFIKLLARLLEPRTGEILLDNRALADYSRRELAQRIAYVPQESFFAWDFTVTETVLQGRHSYLKALQRYHSSDYDLVHTSLRRLGIEGLASKGINHISSGERQLAVVARSLVQQPSVILLDEPLNHLDLAHQHQVLGLLKELNQEGMGVVLVAHDLNQAALVSERMLVFSRGTLAEDGNPDDLLKPEMVEQYWGIKPLQGRHPKSKKRQIFLPF